MLPILDGADAPLVNPISPEMREAVLSRFAAVDPPPAEPIVWGGWTARELYDKGMAVDPETGEVWDWEDCRACGGEGSETHYPLGYGNGSETLACDECAGEGRYPAKDYTRKDAAP